MVANMLERPALVLNRNWQPVNVATVARVLVLLWNESARVVDPSDYQTYTWETGRSCGRVATSGSSKPYGFGCVCRK